MNLDRIHPLAGTVTAVLIVLLLAANPAIAAEPGGRIEGVLGDGLELNIQHATAQDGLLHLQGQARGTLTRQQFPEGTRDDADTLEIDLSFSVQIGNPH